ncbi:hypothetical protein ABEX29_00960 [Brevibacillus porteri]|uniref:hypothetical protein n=1 Tax=Brevibacillus porteri TaxID=2126350 RepID=UPI003D1E1B9E
MEQVKLSTFGTVICLEMPDVFPNEVLEHSVVVFEIERQWLETHLITNTDYRAVEDYLSQYDWADSMVVFKSAWQDDALITVSFTYHHR